MKSDTYYEKIRTREISLCVAKVYRGIPIYKDGFEYFVQTERELFHGTDLKVFESEINHGTFYIGDDGVVHANGEDTRLRGRRTAR